MILDCCYFGNIWQELGPGARVGADRGIARPRCVVCGHLGLRGTRGIFRQNPARWSAGKESDSRIRVGHDEGRNWRDRRGRAPPSHRYLRQHSKLAGAKMTFFTRSQGASATAIPRGKTAWSPRTPWPWSRGLNGERLGDFVMGRKTNGRWQYRNMTDEEARDWQDAVQSY